MKTLISPDAALAIVLEHCAFIGQEVISLDSVAGRTLAADIVSPFDLPTFDNASMDGFALVATDAFAATPEHPAELQLLETVAAGSQPHMAVTPGYCSGIMTGAPLPAGADSVVMREETSGPNDGRVVIIASVRSGQNVRLVGSDVRRGEVVLPAGTVVRACQWAMMASSNQTTITVARIPQVAVIVTGNECVLPGTTAAAGKIFESNSYALRGLIADSGCQAEVVRVGDAPELLRDAIAEVASTFDAVVTSGGVSVGNFDPVREVLPEVAEIHFWKVTMKPGKPVMFGNLKSSGIPVFGLPGNPASVVVTFEQFVRPALLQMQNRKSLQRPHLAVKVIGSFGSSLGRTEYVRAVVRPGGADGHWSAVTTGDQGSGRGSSLAGANALLIVPAEVDRVNDGATLFARMIDWNEVEGCH